MKLKPIKPIILISSIFIFTYVFLVNAWYCDDAYITFRTVDNFINGYGLTWNIAERVQAFTHPLWMFIVSFFYSITNEIFFTVQIISLLLNILTILFIFKIFQNSVLKFILVFLIILLSKSFIDFSSSGLENCLSNFLLVFLILFLKENIENKMTILSSKKIFIITLATSFLLLTRLDLGLVIFPLLIFLLGKNRSLKNFKAFLLGISPFLLWELFSFFYYGVLIPNTALAKLNTGIDKFDYLVQGLKYYYVSFLNDPVTLFAIISCFLSFVYNWISNKRLSLLNYFSLGIFLYLLYIVYIGGDYMEGRFLCTPFLISLIILFINILKIKKSHLLIISIFIVIIFQVSDNIPLLSWVNYGTKYSLSSAEHGISDERAYYYPKAGILPVLIARKSEIQFKWAIEGQLSKDQKEHRYFSRLPIGFFGFYAGPDIFIIDAFALADPLLSRLPISNAEHVLGTPWRIGHFYRRLPLGYYESIKMDSNQIVDENTSAYYQKIKLITRGNLFSLSRIKTAFKLLFANFDTDNYIKDYRPLIESADTASLAKYYNDIAYYYVEMKQYQKALESFKVALGYIPKDKRTMSNIMNLEKNLKQYKFKKDFFFLERNIKNGKILQATEKAKQIVKALKEIKNYKAAIEITKLAVRLNPNRADIITSLGTYYFMDGKYSEAEICWKKAISIDPKLIDPYKNLFQYYSKIKKDKIISEQLRRKIIQISSDEIN